MLGGRGEGGEEVRDELASEFGKWVVRRLGEVYVEAALVRDCAEV